MSVAILTAIGDSRWESDLTSRLRQDAADVEVVRRCVDLTDLLAVAATGTARAVVLSVDLRRLDRSALAQLAAAQVAVVGLVEAGDVAATQRLRGLGIGQVVGHDADSPTVCAAVLAAVADLSAPAEINVVVDDLEPMIAATSDGHRGIVVAVWGAAGAPGRSTIAVNLAAELAALSHEVIVIDADTYGGAVATLLGIVDEAPGVAAACRLAAAGSLDAATLASAVLSVGPQLRVLTGISRPDRWAEVRPAALGEVVQCAAQFAGYVVVDCGFCLEQPDALPLPASGGGGRNDATTAVIAAANVVVGVAAADPIGLARYVRALPDCLALAPTASIITVANRLRSGVVGSGEPARQVVGALRHYARISEVHVVPEDRAALDSAIAAGRTLSEAAPKSSARTAIRELAIRVSGGRTTSKRGRRRAG